jgi:exodeoxyribonuclease VII large subunit
MDLFVEKEEKPSAVLKVSELTRQIRDLLQGEFASVEVEGEISNFHRHGSGHLYFSLKDAGAQIRAVMFRGEAGRLGKIPRDGDAVIVEGEVTVYEPRGEYQIRVRKLKPRGKGSLQEQFEALKQKLLAEGLFSPERKRPLPAFPERVAVITSPTGAAVRDFLNVLRRRCPRIAIQVFGVKVQGEGAGREVAAALLTLNELNEVDVIVVARGGGSIEDLWAFNEEEVARAIAASEIPVISGVGHEVDFTIADFVADLRAPTPSAAAELLSRADGEWREDVAGFATELGRLARQICREGRERLTALGEHYVFKEPIRMIDRWWQRVDELESRLGLGLTRRQDRARELFAGLVRRWERVDLTLVIRRKREELLRRKERLFLLSPESSLKRGYALVLDSKGKLVRRAEEVAVGAGIEVRLGNGRVEAVVEGVFPKKEEN